MLAISDLHVAYGQSEVLHGLNVTVAPNEIVAIMGRNGMGKTTLMKSLMGIVPTKSGSVTMEGAESTLKSYERVAKGLAYVPQGRMIFSTMTVRGKHRDRAGRVRRDRGARRHLRAVSRCCWK
jgi:urea transport system ATP-binding protein